MLKQFLFTLLLRFIYSQDCILEVPDDPLNTGLFKTWYISTKEGSDITCSQLIPQTASFVEATIFNIPTKSFYIYNPLVLDKGTTSILPILPGNITNDDIVVLHFGTNSNSLSLISQPHNCLTCKPSLVEANCVQGINNSNFGQFSYCNAENFFNTVNQNCNIPLVDKTILGDECPTVRSFTIVDQDQSDNVVTQYILTDNDIVAQDTPENRLFLESKNETLKFIQNGSDERILILVSNSIGCKPLTAPDFINKNILKSSLVLNELQSKFNSKDTGLIPSNNPMVLVDNLPSLEKINAYRIGVNQPIITSLDEASTLPYCINMDKFALPFFYKYQSLLESAISPNDDTANNLLNFLAFRFVNSWTILNCTQLTNFSSRLIVYFDENNVVISNNLNSIFQQTTSTIPTTTTSIPTTTNIYSKSFCGYDANTINCNLPCLSGKSIDCGDPLLYCYMAENLCNPKNQTYSKNFCGININNIDCNLPCFNGQNIECHIPGYYCYVGDTICYQTTTPIVDTTTPIVDTTTPIVDTTTPIVDTTTPIVDTTTPIVDTTTPIVDTTTPIIDTTTQIVDTTTPIIDTTTPIVDTTTPIVDTTTPIVDTTTPIVDTTNSKTSKTSITTTNSKTSITTTKLLTTKAVTTSSKNISLNYCGVDEFNIDCNIPCPNGQNIECGKPNLFCFVENTLCPLPEPVINNSNNLKLSILSFILISIILVFSLF